MSAKSVSAWFDQVVAATKVSEVVTEELARAVGAEADEAGDTSMRHGESYEDFETRRFRAIGHGALTAIETAGLALVPTKEDPARLEKVARSLARAQVEYEAAEAEFQFAAAPDGKPLDIDMDAEVEALWPDYLPAARAAINAFLGKEE